MFQRPCADPDPSVRSPEDSIIASICVRMWLSSASLLIPPPRPQPAPRRAPPWPPPPRPARRRRRVRAAPPLILAPAVPVYPVKNRLDKRGSLNVKKLKLWHWNFIFNSKDWILIFVIFDTCKRNIFIESTLHYILNFICYSIFS